MKRILIALFTAVVTSLCVAQTEPFTYCGQLMPSRTFFQENGDWNLFKQYLSLFDIHDKKNKVSFDIYYYDPPEKELDSIYWRYIVRVPGFKVFPGIRVDCKNGYLVGLCSIFDSYRTTLCNWDFITYDKEGRMLERISFPVMNNAFYWDKQDTCTMADFLCVGKINILKGSFVYEYTSLRFCAPEMARGVFYEYHEGTKKNEEKVYMYKIDDDARLILVSESELETD